MVVHGEGYTCKDHCGRKFDNKKYLDSHLMRIRAKKSFKMRKVFLFDQESVNLSDSKPRCADDLKPVASESCMSPARQVDHHFEENKNAPMAKQQSEDVDQLVGTKRLHHDLIESPMLQLDHRHDRGSPTMGDGNFYHSSRVNLLEQSPPIMENFGEMLQP